MPAGKMVYHGHRQGILPFFASIGMNCPARKADSDFLQEVTSRKDQQVLLLVPSIADAVLSFPKYITYPEVLAQLVCVLCLKV